MCTGFEGLLASAATSVTGAVSSIGGWGTVASAAGSLLSGGSQFGARSDASGGAAAAAGSALVSAEDQARTVRRIGQREVSAARAAIAGNNTALDEFALINTREIERAAEQDAQMSLLTGRREADSLMQQASGYGSSAVGSLASSLLSSSGQAYTGWKGAQKVTI